MGEAEEWGKTENSCFFVQEGHCKPTLPGVRAAVFTQLHTLYYMEILIQFGYKQTFTLSEFKQGQKLTQEHSLSEWGQSSEARRKKILSRWPSVDIHNINGSN